MRISSRSIVLLCMILGLAVGLRVWGLHWGLPNLTHYYSYHPDEPFVLDAAQRINFFEGQLDPGFYNYGSLYIYLVNAAILVGVGWGLIALDPTGGTASAVRAFAGMHMAGRITAVVLGVATVWLVYILGRRMYGRTAGLLAALFTAVLPLHTMHSRFVAVDVPAACFAVAALVFAARIVEGRRMRDYLLSGLFAGLAAATKYEVGLVLLAPAAAHFAGGGRKSVVLTSTLKLLGIAVGGAVGFLAGCPGVLLNYGKFAEDFAYEAYHVKTWHGLVFARTGSGFVYHLANSLYSGMGLPLLALAIIGLLYALKKRTPHDKVLLAFFVPYYLLIGLVQVRFARYTIPILPVMVLFAARVSADAVSRLRRSRMAIVSIPIVVLILVFVSGYALLYSLALDDVFAGRDTRDRAAVWIRQNIPPGSSIGVPTIPWFYTPPIGAGFGAGSAGERYREAQEVTDYVIVTSPTDEWDAGLLREAAPDYVVMSQFEYQDRLRIRDPSALRYLRVLRREYRQAAVFEREVSILGRKLPLMRPLPHDMSYASPTILVYMREPGGG